MTERPDTDWLALADRLDPDHERSASTGIDRLSDLRAAAEALRQLAAITAAIGDPEFLRNVADGISSGMSINNANTILYRIADAASLTPTPTPDSDGSDG